MNILEVITDLRIGGAQRVAANIGLFARAEDHITYLVFDHQIGDYEHDLRAHGHDVIHISAPSGGYLRHLRTLYREMRNGKYDVVHCHNMYSCGIVMLLGAMSGIQGRISHSHTAEDNELRNSFARRIYKRFMRELIWHFGTDYLACGEKAGEELYGAKRFRRKGVLIPNGIDIAAYAYAPENRKQMRAQFGVRDQFVVGHVGHYVDVKNQVFLIRLMPEIQKHRPDAVLLLFGEGKDRPMLEEEIATLSLSDSVRLMGNVNNIPQVLSALDVFAFPSLMEGTPLALLEAQANGLPCIVSEAVPGDACITDLIRKIPLSDVKRWAAEIASAQRPNGAEYTSVLKLKYEDVRESMVKLGSIFQKYRFGG